MRELVVADDVGALRPFPGARAAEDENDRRVISVAFLYFRRFAAHRSRCCHFFRR